MLPEAIQILTFTALYPDCTRPSHGIFVENRLRHLVSNSKIRSRVTAPVPWFPSTNRRWGDYSAYARVPRYEIRYGIEVEHPRYPLIPKIGMTISPWLMSLALQRHIRRVIESGFDFDIFDAHYFYPDGVAASLLSRRFGKPVVITARGTDVNLIANHYFPRKMIQMAARSSAALIVVSQALKSRLIDLGIDGRKITVLRNGVDLNAFRPRNPKAAVRNWLKAGEKLLLSVGGLQPFKGQDITIRALASLPECKLIIVGEGPSQRNLQRLVASLNLNDRVIFLGRILHQDLVDYYSAADALVHTSSREGWPNVILESLACGTPVVATSVGGIPEIITKPDGGVLVGKRTASAVASGIRELFSAYPERSATRRFAEQFSWDETTAGQERLFSLVVAKCKVSAKSSTSSGQKQLSDNSAIE